MLRIYLNKRMDVIYTKYLGRSLAPCSEWDWEVRKAVKRALELVEGKGGFKTQFEKMHYCKLEITVGHNIYTTSIHIEPDERYYKKSLRRWVNRYAYYCNGVFWGSFTRTEVDLI